MDRQQIDEIVCEFEKERPRWVLIHGQPGSGRTTLARRLVVSAVHELSLRLEEFAPGFTTQVQWYCRDDQWGSRAQSAHNQLAKTVTEVADIEMREVPITYIPKTFDRADLLHDIIGKNVLASVFDDLWPGADLCLAVERRLKSRDFGVLITTAVSNPHRADGLSASILTDFGEWLSRTGNKPPWTVYRLER